MNFPSRTSSFSAGKSPPESPQPKPTNHSPTKKSLRRNTLEPSLGPRRVVLPDPQPAIALKSTPLSRPSSYKKGGAVKGGAVKKTGLAKPHKGELVLTKKKAQAPENKTAQEKETS